MPSKLHVAQHEAAHIVVGVALGLRLYHATIVPAPGEDCYGYAWFPYGGTRLAQSLCDAAGVAWERAVGGRLHAADLENLRARERSEAAVRAAVRAAADMLAARGPVHARVTRALLERDLRGRDIEALARGERI